MPFDSNALPSIGAAPQPSTRHAWEDALAYGDTEMLLGLNGYHLAQFPKVAPAFADLVHELRFSDLGSDTRAAFVREVLTTLRQSGALAAREHCLRGTAQLEDEYARRHTRGVLQGPA